MLFQVATENDIADGDRRLPKHVIIGKEGRFMYIGDMLSPHELRSLVKSQFTVKPKKLAQNIALGGG